MSGISKYWTNRVADAIAGIASLPTTVYIALVTREPYVYESGSDLAEPSGGGYARVSYLMNSSNWSAASSGTCQSKSLVNFTNGAGSNWGRVVAWVATSASSGGEILFWGTLDSPVTINVGNSVKIPIGGMEFTVEAPSQVVFL